MRIGSIGISWSFTKHPFTPFIRTSYCVVGSPTEGPLYVRQLTHWLWLIVSKFASQKVLEEAKAQWFAPEKLALREQVRSEYERAVFLQKENSDVSSIH